MLILGKLHDYYDAIQSLGIDKQTVLMREQSEYKIKRDSVEEKLTQKYLYAQSRYGYSHAIIDVGSHYGLTIDAGIVLFCGRVYPFVHIPTYVHEQYTSLATHHFIFDESQLRKFINDHSNEIKNFSKGIRYGMKSFDEVIPKIQRVLSASGVYDEEVVEFLREKNVAYASLVAINRYPQSATCTLYPLLKDMHFQHVIDPYTAYQEVYMFVGNLPKPAREMYELSDKEQLYKKGFYNMSFKKEPTKKRK